MNEKEEKLSSHIGAEEQTASGDDALDSVKTPSRRELIERYGKYAIVAAPLLLFASKARAIHSKP